MATLTRCAAFPASRSCFGPPSESTCQGLKVGLCQTRPRRSPDRVVQVPPADTPGVQGLLTLAVAVVIVAGLYLGREVMIPIILAVLLSFLLAPVANFLRRLRLGRVPSALLAVVLALGIILMIGTLIGTQLADLAQEVPRYASSVERKVETLQSHTLGRITTVMRSLGHELDRAGAPKNSSSGAATPSGSLGEEQRSRSRSRCTSRSRVPYPLHTPNGSSRRSSHRWRPRRSSSSLRSSSCCSGEDLRDRLPVRLLFGSSDLHRTTVAMNDAARRLSNYFLTQLAINAMFGVIIGTGLFFIEAMPFSPLLWGVLAMVLRFVPYIGAPLSALLPIALAAAIDPGWSMVMWTAALYAIVEAIMGQAVEPLLYGQSTGLSPFSVVVAATFWTWLWGPIGLILSTPLTLCLVVLGRHVERLEFLDILLGDRPPLTPVESFYQRILAGDPDEARAQAELLLKDHSLSSYYEQVALKGLQLAAADSARGVLTGSRIERVSESIASLVEDLDEYDDQDPSLLDNDHALTAPTRAEQDLPTQAATEEPIPPELPASWRGPAPVMCLAGRGPLDEAASLMLAQLLQKHGLGATVLPHATAGSRAAIRRA